MAEIRKQPVIMFQKRRIYLLLTPLLVLFMGIGNPPLAVAGEMVHDDMATVAYIKSLQTLTVSETAAEPAVVERASYTVTVVSVVQWPVSKNSGQSKGFGAGAGSCEGCSHFHQGQDLLPGAGTPVVPISKGVIVSAGDEGSLGQTVRISHVIDGVAVESVYAHMQYGSIAVTVGQEVGLDTVIGAVGSTGAATGPHLHLEIHVNGIATSPLPWLKAHANSDLWNL